MTFLQGEFQPFCMLFILEDITQYCFITQVQIGKLFLPKFLQSPWRNGQRVCNGHKGSWVQIPEDLKGYSFSENQHRGPYFVGFQTKWIMIHQVTIHNAVIKFSMFLASSLDFYWPYCAMPSDVIYGRPLLVKFCIKLNYFSSLYSKGFIKGLQYFISSIKKL